MVDGELKPVRGKIDKKIFSGNIHKTTWFNIPDQTHHFEKYPKRIDVGIKTFNAVKYSIKRRTNITDETELNKLAEVRLLKYRTMREFIRKELSS